MKQNLRLLVAALFASGALLAASIAPALAESEVLESTIDGFPIGTKIDDGTRIVMPDDSKLRVLLLSSGTTKTLQGPYEGTIPDYKDERSWWERITGRGKESDAPIGATRGLVPPPKTDQPQ